MNQSVLLLFLLIFVWLGILTFFVYKYISHYQKLVTGAENKNLIEILDNILKNLALNEKNVEELKQELFKIAENSVYHIQKVGILRFNPFADTGGDQSFVLAILDGTDSGIVLTSLHSRGITRWYAKNVKEAKGVDYDLSKEEILAIKKSVPINKAKERKKSL